MKIILRNFLIAILALPVLTLASCDEENEDVIQEPGKEGSVETRVAIQHLDKDHDLLVTTHKIWVKNQLLRQVSYTDTLPSLGTTTETGGNQEGEQASVTVPKDYEVYITVQ